jgi:flagellar FliJ protein
MKKFKFRLEPLLKIKAHIEREKQKHLALAAQQVVAQETYLHELNRDRQAAQNEQRGYLSGMLKPNLLLNYSRYFLKLKKNELTGSEILKVYRIEREKRRQDLLEATKQKKIYEKLKEHKKDSYQKEMETIIRKEQDDIASKMFHRKKKLPL